MGIDVSTPKSMGSKCFCRVSGGPWTPRKGQKKGQSGYRGPISHAVTLSELVEKLPGKLVGRGRGFLAEVVSADVGGGLVLDERLEFDQRGGVWFGGLSAALPIRKSGPAVDTTGPPGEGLSPPSPKATPRTVGTYVKMRAPASSRSFVSKRRLDPASRSIRRRFRETYRWSCSNFRHLPPWCCP